MKPSGPVRGERSPILIGDCVALPLPLLVTPHAARSKEISRKRISVVRFRDDVVNGYMCFLLMHTQTFVVLDSRLRERPTFSDRSFPSQESAANALTKRLDGYLLKTNDRHGLDCGGDTSFRVRDRVGPPPCWLKARSQDLQSDCARSRAHTHILTVPAPYSRFAHR